MKKKNKPLISQNPLPKKTVVETPVQPAKVVKSSPKSVFLPNDSPSLTFSNKIAFGILMGLLLLSGFWLFKDFLLSKKTTLYLDIGSDMTNAFYPIYKMATDYFHQYGLLNWSFKQGMGQDISPFMNSPLYFLYYLGDGKNIPLIAGWVEFLRILLNGIAFFWYLKIIKYNNFTGILGGICFALMGFTAMVLGWTPLLANSLLYTILLLISIEYLIRNTKWYLLPIATMLIAIDQPFNFTIIAEFCIAYLFVRLYAENMLNNWANNGKLLLKISLLGGLGIGMGFFICYSHILLLLNSPRGSGDVAYTDILSSQAILQPADSIELFTSYLRWFSNDILGYVATYRAWQNYMEAPAFYVGLGMLLLLPQLFIFSDRRHRIAYGAATGFVLLIITFSYFRYALWLFTGNYYRVMAAFIACSLLLGSLKVIEAIVRGYKINLIVLISTFIALLVPLFYDFSPDFTALINKPVRSAVLFFLFFHTLILAATRFDGLKTSMLWAFLGFTVIEMTYFANLTINKREIQTVADFKSKIGYNDYTMDAMDYINKQDKSFFRVEKTYSSGSAVHQSLNDAMVQNYRSTSSYHSFNHRYYVAFMKGFNVIASNNEIASRWISGVRGRPLLMPLISVKYYLVKGQLPFQKFGFDSLTTFQDVKVFKNKLSLPMGFTYDKYMTVENFNKWSLVQKDLASYRGFIIKNDEKMKYGGLTEVKDSLQTITLDDYQKLINECKTDTLQMTSYDDRHFEGKIDLNHPKLLFLTIPFDAGWKAEVDGKPTEIKLVTFGMSGILLDKGKHQVRIYYEAPYFKVGRIVSLISILLYGLLVGFVFWKDKKKEKLAAQDEV